MTRVSCWVYISNSCDGSNSLRFFDTEDAAEAYAESDEERNCEDIKKIDLLFNDDGYLIKPEGNMGWNINPIRK